MGVTIFDAQGHQLAKGMRVKSARGEGVIVKIGFGGDGHVFLVLHRAGAHSALIWATTAVDTNGPLGIHFTCPDLKAVLTPDPEESSDA